MQAYVYVKQFHTLLHNFLNTLAFFDICLGDFISVMRCKSANENKNILKIAAFWDIALCSLSEVD
jgi:hypothetical protein